MELNKLFKKVYADKKKLFLVIIILAFLSLTYSGIIKKAITIIAFILISGISKIYHKFFKSTLGIDLVFFTTAVISVAYNNLFLSLFVGWSGLILADSLGTKFTHFSLVTLIGLSAVSLISGTVLFLPAVTALIVLMIVFEIITIIFYFIMGSSADKIAVFFFSHLLFNLFLILNFSTDIIKLIS